jgi:putative mRNA 3-end processing factor
VEDDGLTTPFEPVECTHFVTESTFGLPVFDWRPQQEVIADITRWWKSNQKEGKVSIISAYALGKAQRIIEAIDHSVGKIFVHGAIHNVNEALSRNGIQIQPTILVSPDIPKAEYTGALVIAPGSAWGISWTKRFQPFAVAQVSGWMNIHGIKKRRGSNHGFVLSDHADWKGLIEAVKLTKAENIYVTHGYKSVLSRWLSEKGGMRIK